MLIRLLYYKRLCLVYFATGCVVGTYRRKQNCEKGLSREVSNFALKRHWNLRGRSKAKGCLCAQQAWSDIQGGWRGWHLERDFNNNAVQIISIPQVEGG